VTLSALLRRGAFDGASGERRLLGALYVVAVTLALNIPDDLARRLEAAARSRGISIETAVVEALTSWAAGESMPELSFVGIGEGRPDLAESHDEILAEHLRTAL